jgi:hypothetical protein
MNPSPGHAEEEAVGSGGIGWTNVVEPFDTEPSVAVGYGHSGELPPWGERAMPVSIAMNADRTMVDGGSEDW